MLDAQLRRLIDPPLDRLGRLLARRGITANQITIAGFLFGTAAFPALAFEAYGWALAALAANRMADGLDGAVARQRGVTDLGGYLDIVLDLIFYAGFVFFFALGRPDQALIAAFLIFSFMGTGASFLGFAIMAAKRGIGSEIRGKKSLYYLGGLTEGFETIVVLSLTCLFPDWFFWLALIFGVLCWITTASRIAAAVQAFREQREITPPPREPAGGGSGG